MSYIDKAISEKLLQQLKVKESDILNILKDVRTLSARKIIETIFDNNRSILAEILSWTLDTDDEKIGVYRLANLVHKRLHNLSIKKYLTPLKADDGEYFYSLNNLFNVGLKIDEEVVIRSNYDKTILYYNNSEDTKIVEIKIKTQASLQRTDFINIDAINFEVKKNKRYNEYIINCVCDPFTYIEVLTDKFHKSLNNINIDNPLKTLYKYYGMKVSINDNKLIELPVDDIPENRVINLEITNTSEKFTFYSIFIDGCKSENIFLFNQPVFANSILNVNDIVLEKGKKLFVYFNMHDNCIIRNSLGRILYHPDVSKLN